MLHFGAGLHGHEYSTSPSRPVFPPAASRTSRSYDSPIDLFIRPEYRRRSLETRRPSDRTSFAMSDDGRTNVASDGSDRSDNATLVARRRRKRSKMPSTTYAISLPAPTALTQGQRLLDIKPKLLLQFQRLAAGSRPVPTLDVLPSTTVVPRLTKHFPRLFRTSKQLGTYDVMVVKSEDYLDASRPLAEISGERPSDHSDEREVLAVICQLPGEAGTAEICLKDGTTWHATPLKNGSFDFLTLDPTASRITRGRWCLRQPKKDSVTEGAASGVAPLPRWSFSFINPDSRRHPVVAWLTSESLEVFDAYTAIPNADDEAPLGSPLPTPGTESNFNMDGSPVDPQICHLSADEKTFIQIAAIWVALRQGWCPVFKYNDVLQGPSSRSTTPSSNRRAVGHNSKESPAKSTPESGTSSLRGRLRNTSAHLLRGNPPTSHARQYDPNAPVPTRSVSAGAQFMQRMTATRRGTGSSSIGTPSETDRSIGPGTSVELVQSCESRPTLLSPSEHSAVTELEAATYQSASHASHRRVQSQQFPLQVDGASKMGIGQNRHSVAYPITQADGALNSRPATRDRELDGPNRRREPIWRRITNLFLHGDRR